MREIGAVLVHPWASLLAAAGERSLRSSVYWSLESGRKSFQAS